MRHAITLNIVILVVAATTSVTSHALDGENGYTATSLLTPADVKSDVTYPAGVRYVEKWQDLDILEFWAPIGPGQREGIAAGSSGDLFVLVRGKDDTSADFPRYTGLIKVDGTKVEHLIQDETDTGWLATREGSVLQAVVASPCKSGLLEKGYPVVLRHVFSGQGPARTFHAEVVMVNPVDGTETSIYTFGSWSDARVAIDGSGTIYVGPLSDGSIAKLTYVGSAYVESTVPGTFSAGCALIVGPNGDLYTFSSDETFEYASRDEKDIYRIVPSTGAASVYASVDGSNFPRDWVMGSDGTLWIALHQASGKKCNYVTDVVSGKTTTSKNRISDSDTSPWSIAAGPDGKIYVLENPFLSSGEIWLLTPGSGGGGGGGGKPPKPPKKPK